MDVTATHWIVKPRCTCFGSAMLGGFLGARSDCNWMRRVSAKIVNISNLATQAAAINCTSAKHRQGTNSTNMVVTPISQSEA